MKFYYVIPVIFCVLLAKIYRRVGLIGPHNRVYREIFHDDKITTENCFKLLIANRDKEESILSITILIIGNTIPFILLAMVLNLLFTT